jgi:hypothetical protein
MKLLSVFIAFLFSSLGSFAQYADEEEKGFKKENIYFGGSIIANAGGWNNSFVIGINPEVGYSITRWLDAGIMLNTTYSAGRFTERDVATGTLFDVRSRNFNYGGGVYLRIHPFNGFFIQAQPEFNCIRVNQRVMNISGLPDYKETFSAASTLAGIGWGQRIVGQSSFYTCIMVDLLNNKNTPYGYVNEFGNLVKLPVFRAGFTIYLKPSGGKRG